MDFGSNPTLTVPQEIADLLIKNGGPDHHHRLTYREAHLITYLLFVHKHGNEPLTTDRYTHISYDKLYGSLPLIGFKTKQSCSRMVKKLIDLGLFKSQKDKHNHLFLRPTDGFCRYLGIDPEPTVGMDERKSFDIMTGMFVVNPDGSHEEKAA